MELQQLNEVLVRDLVRMAILCRNTMNKAHFNGSDAKEVYELQEMCQTIFKTFVEESNGEG